MIGRKATVNGLVRVFFRRSFESPARSVEGDDMTTATSAATDSRGAAGEGLIRNPVLPGFHPDPSILRVGTDYYIATSTF